jgi:hypothetical protein
MEEVEQPPVAERIKLVEHLLATLDKPDPDIDRVWAEESERRLDAYLPGQTTSKNATDVLAKHLKR